VSLPATLTDAALRVLGEPDPAGKVRLTFAFATAWRESAIAAIGEASPPPRPARPAKPQLISPGDMPKRSTGGGPRRLALLHAIAHIELNAIDLGWDIIARFATPELPRAFYDDWVRVAEDEARHFAMLSDRLIELGAAYGDLPAHDGLWEAAEKTANDLLARLALVPMVLEARGLDTTPPTVAKLKANGDEATAALLHEIAEDEISHVAAGVRWFEHGCTQRGLEPVATYKGLVAKHFRGQIKPPFNLDARDRAQFARAYYEP
jgi:uncharacterized ferritin-like protein (DUF455 family)